MKALKIAGIVVGTVALLVAGGIAVVALRFDADRIKAELARVVLEQKQRTLKIDGALELGFWPNVGVKLGKLSLSERNSEQEFASVEAARVAVAVLPLLSQRVVADTIEISGARAVIVRHADGTLNIDDLMAADEEEHAPMQIDIAGIKLADAQLTWRDEKSGSAATLAGLDLATGRVQADTGRKTLQIEGLSLAAKGKSGGDKSQGDGFDVALAAPLLSVAPGRAASETVTLTAVLADAGRSATARLTLSGVEGTGQALKITRLAFDLDAKSGAVAVKGALGATLTADPEHRTLALEKFAGEFDIVHPQMPAKHLTLPFSGTLRADLARQSAAGKLAARFDESKLALEFDVAKFAPLALDFDLAIDRLNADKYLPPKKPGGKSEGKLDFEALRGLDLNGTVKVGSLQWANVKASNVTLRVRSAAGRLDIASDAPGLHGGTGIPPGK